MFSTLQLHEIEKAFDKEPVTGNSLATDHFFCPVCHAVFDYEVDTGNYLICYFDTPGEEILPDQNILPSRTFVFKDGRSPPRAV